MEGGYQEAFLELGDAVDEKHSADAYRLDDGYRAYAVLSLSESSDNNNTPDSYVENMPQQLWKEPLANKSTATLIEVATLDTEKQIIVRASLTFSHGGLLVSVIFIERLWVSVELSLSRAQGALGPRERSQAAEAGRGLRASGGILWPHHHQ